MKVSAILTLGLVALLGGCASTNLEHAQGASLQERPADEVSLWNRAAETEERLASSGLLVKNAAAEEYLNQVLSKIAPEPLAPGVYPKAKVIMEPTLNAFALPNGTIYVHTGLLAQVENEAQLVAILAHEAAHSYLRHGLRNQRSVDNKLAAIATLNSATAGAAVLVSVPFGIGAIAGYSRELEREADQRGFEILVAQGYDPREAVAVFKLIEAEINRTKIKQSFFFGSHPRIAERIQNFTDALNSLPAEKRVGSKETESLMRATRDLWPTTARAALATGDSGLALHCLDRFRASGENTPEASALFAEILRRRAGPGDWERAKLDLEKTIERFPDSPRLYRELGLILQRQGEIEESKRAFQSYLRLQPAAEDKKFIESMLL